MRKEKNGTRYFGFDEIAKSEFGINPASNQNQNVSKNKDSIQKFEKYNTCINCKQPLTYIGGNVACCKNPECKKPSYKLLDDKGKLFAKAIYGVKEATV